MRTISFSRSTHEEFNKVLQSRVREYFKSKKISRYANSNMVFKTIFMLSLYIIPYLFIVTSIGNSWSSLLMWTLMGFGMAGIGLSIMHDANHGAYSKRPTVNKVMGWALLALGGSDVNWRIQHNILHHTYTNIEGMDEDIHAPLPILRFNPHERLRKIHRFQFIYAWFLYALMTLTWIFSKDYIRTVRYTKQGLMQTQGISVAKHWTILIITKMIYFAVLLVIPILIDPQHWYIAVIGFLIMHFICGFILTVIFQPAHVVPSTDFPVPDVNEHIESDWTVHQLYTTSNFAPNSRFFSWFIGGLNYQIEHHLFPNICHVHYRKLSVIVKQTALEYNLPYYSTKTFAGALKEHGTMLFALGRK